MFQTTFLEQIVLLHVESLSHLQTDYREVILGYSVIIVTFRWFVLLFRHLFPVNLCHRMVITGL